MERAAPPWYAPGAMKPASCWHHRWRIAGLPALCLLIAAARAQPREPLDLIPADTLLCWHGRPLPDTSPVSSQPSALQTLLELGMRMAGQSLDSGTQLGVRLAEMFNLTIRYPHALTLIDARALPVGPDQKGRRVDRLRFALVVESGDQTEPFLRVIQKAVNEQTDQAEATLLAKRAGRWSYQELRDKRLPDWAVVAWGQIDKHFVLTIGADVWPNVAAVAAGQAPALSQDAWYKAAREKRGQPALLEILLAAHAIQERLDPFFDGQASAFFKAWDAADIDQAYWALGFEGRALFCRASYRVGRETVDRLYADPDIREPRLLETIPPDARYAIYKLPLDRFLPRFFRGLLALEGQKARANIERVWAEMQAQRAFDAERDVLAHLGEYVVLHNDPPHPLRIPLAMTILIEIRDEPAAVRRTLETLFTAWRDTLAESTEDGRPVGPFTLQRDDDGVWYMQFGPLAGPAWTTTDRFIISSWSPQALREYLAKVGARVR
jgi:hypothetical protein